MKQLTITVPSYNVEKYLDRCLTSLIDESILEDIEVIIVNDGSHDGTAAIAQKYVDRYPGTFILINKENGGHGSTINTGIARATGRYFCVLDGDDWVDIPSFVQLVEKIRCLYTDLIALHYSRISAQDGSAFHIPHVGYQYDKVYHFNALDLKTVYFAMASMLYKTSILKEHDIRLQEKTYYVDVEYMLLPMPYVNDIVFLDLYVYRYYVGNPDQSIDIQNFVRRYAFHDKVIKRLVTETGSLPAELPQKQYIDYILARVIQTHFDLSTLHNQDRELGRKQALEFDAWLKENDKKLYDLSCRSPYMKVMRSSRFDLPRAHRTINRLKRIKSLFSLRRTKQLARIMLYMTRRFLGRG